MREICVIGDSHIAALKAGWNHIQADYAEIRLSFFGAPGAYMKDLAAKGPDLVPTSRDLRAHLRRTSEGRVKIAGDFDSYILCGMDFSMRHVSKVCADCCLAIDARDGRLPLSRRCYIEVLCACLRTTLAAVTLAKLRRVSQVPIVVLPSPMCGESHPAPAKFDRDEAGLFAVLFSDACTRVAAERQAQFLPQPAQTLADDPLATKAVFAMDAERIYATRAETDHLHMNAEYGALMLRAALDFRSDG